VELCIWNIALCGAETWTLWQIDWKYCERFYMWCWSKVEKINWTDHVKNEQILCRGKEERNILHTVGHGKANWIGHILHG